MKFLSTLLLFFIFAVPSLAAEYSVGVSPPFIDLGTVGKGSSNLVKFYIVTVSPDPLTVRLSSEPGNTEYLKAKGLNHLLSNFSMESAHSWVTFFSNPVELLPTDTNVGFGIKGAREIKFLLSIPSNAEPGYRLISIRPTPLVSPSDSGTVGAQIVAVSPIHILLNVEGEPKSEGRILDVIYNDGKIETFFKNTGTVSIIAGATHRVHDSQDNTLEALSSRDFIQPAELKKMGAPLQLETGYYTVETTVDYSSGSAALNSTIAVKESSYVEVKQEAEIFSAWVYIAIVAIVIISFALFRWVV